MGRRERPLRFIRNYEISDNLRNERHLLWKAYGQPIIMGASGFALPTAVQAQNNHVLLPGGGYLHLFQTTAQTLMPDYDVSIDDGIEIALDQVDNESVEYVPGGNFTRSPLSFVVDTDSSFFIRAKFKIPDVSGTDETCIGFRKQEAFAVPTSIVGDGIYTDFAVLVAASGDVKTATDLNNSGTAVVTDTLFNWADNEVHELEVRVVNGGVAQYLINGTRLGNPVTKDGDGTTITSQSTNTAAVFTFDSGDRLVPFIFCRQAADLSPVYLRELEVGLLVERGLDKASE